MRPDRQDLADRLGAALGVDVAVRVVRALGDATGSGPGAPSTGAQRAAARRALCGVRRELPGGGAGPPAMRFPHPRFSMSHAGWWAAAAGAASGTTAGLGIDVEPIRRIDPRTGRFFLTERELTWASALPEPRRSFELLRLWTVKEAVFKADLTNEEAVVGHYEVHDPAAAQGVAHKVRGEAPPCRYVTVAGAWGVLTLAATPAGPGAP